MEESILRSEVMKQLDTGERFDLVFVTADRKRGTGGELITVRGWQKIIGQPHTPGRKKRPPANYQPPARNPDHRTHKTINIHNPLNRGTHPITVHSLLMQFFNGKRILNG